MGEEWLKGRQARGGKLPNIKEGTIGDLVLPAHSLIEPAKLNLFLSEKKEKILEKSTSSVPVWRKQNMEGEPRITREH